MKRSLVYLGETAEYERRLAARSPSALSSLHVAAQRVAWGIIMGDRVGIDLDEAVRTLLRRHGDQFCAHVTAAMARRAQGRSAEADAHIEKARAIVPSDHPWAKLVPTEAEWRAGPVVSSLVEEVPGRVYRVVGESAAGEGPGSRGVGRFLRMRSGELVYVNPVELPSGVVESVRRLGDVTHIVAPSKYHSNHAPRAKELFPKARLWGVEAHQNYPNVKHIAFDGFLSDHAPLLPGELEHVTMRGVDVGDTWLVDRASGTLLVTDAVFLMDGNVPDADAYRSPFSTFYGWAWGIFDRNGIPSYQPAMWSDVPAYSASIRRALALGFDNVGSCHGSFRAIQGDGPRKLAEHLGWVHELGRSGTVRHLGDFVRRHPGVFFAFVKEQIAARRNQPKPVARA